jgi:hypothetical protein
MELPIWHPRHDAHLRHLDFVAHLVARRIGLQDVEDFLVGASQITPNWADAMLQPIVSRRNRRDVIARSLANKTKKKYSTFEHALMTWNVDADTDVEAVVRAAIDVLNVDRCPSIHASPYFDIVWGFDVADYKEADEAGFTLPTMRHENHVYVKYVPEIERFFGKSTFTANARGYSSRNNNWPRLAAWYGSPAQQGETRNSRLFRVWLPPARVWALTRGHDARPFEYTKPLLVELYKNAQEELARATLGVSCFYMINYMHETTDINVIRAAMERAGQRPRGRGMADMNIDDFAHAYADMFVMT